MKIFRYGAAFELDVMAFFVTVDIDLSDFRQSVNNRSPYAVKAAGYFVTAAAEFTASVQYSHNDFNCRASHFFLHADRDSASVIFYANPIVRFNGDLDFCTMTCQCLIYTIINDFPNQMVKSS